MNQGIYPELLLQNRYRVVNKLGRGGLAETWEVDDGGTRKVLKVLLDDYPKLVELFEREATVLSQLHCPGIPKVEADAYFTFTPKGANEPLHCLVMEFIEGKNLQEWLRENGPIAQEQALSWLQQLVEILAIIHDRQYFHRDIKPSNIMLKPDGQLVLIDFGAVREVTGTFLEKQKQNWSGTKIGTAGYAPPEQARGQAVPQSDFFSLGRTFVYLLTGQEPIEFKEDLVTYELKNNWREKAPEIYEPFAGLIDDLMAPSLEQRAKNASEILLRIEQILIKTGVAFKAVESYIESSFSRLPNYLKFIVEPIKKHHLQLFAKKIRPPKIALYGRSGSGKSSVLNAILGKRVAEVGVAGPVTFIPESYSYERNDWELTFVDTRGVGDTSDDGAIREAIEYIVREKVDVFLFVIPADERSYIANDAQFLMLLKQEHQKVHKVELPIILVINKIDEIAPPYEWNPNPPYNLNFQSEELFKEPESDREEKELNIINAIRHKLREYQNINYESVVPVCAYWDKRRDMRYNIEELVEEIYKNIPESAQVSFAGATAVNSVQKLVASSLTTTAALLAGSGCLIPIPGIDILAVGTIQVCLVETIAGIGSGDGDQKQNATEFIGSLLSATGGAAITFVIKQVCSLIPGANLVANASAAAAVGTITMALGAAAEAFFIDGLSMEEVRQKFEEEKKRVKPEFEKTFVQNSEQNYDNNEMYIPPF